MINHKATISALANELQSIIGSKIKEIYTQDRGELFIEISQNNICQYIEFSTNSPYDRMLLRSKHNRAKANTLDLFGSLIGSKITCVNQVNEDRIMVICTDSHNLYFKLFGHNQSDLIITNKKNKIIQCLHNSETIGTNFHIDTNVQKSISDFDDDVFLEVAMKKCKYYFGKYYTDNYLEKNEYSEKNLLKNLNKVKISEDIDKYYYKIAKSKQSFVYKINDSKYLFSLIELDNYDLYRKYDSISEGIHSKFVREISQKRIYKLKSSCISKLNKAIDKDQKAIDRIDKLSNGESKSEQYRHFAELLISQPNPKVKSDNSIDVLDWDGKTTTIPLDEKLNLIDNSQKYFKKSSSILKERRIAKSKLPEIESKLQENLLLKNFIEASESVKELEEIIKENPKTLGGIMESKGSEKKEDKFKKFELSENYVLYVGKNAKNNDELTMKFAKPNDIWLHARGVGGSHCVIRADGREPSKGIIKEAAAIAAYFSKAKTSNLAPVAYTQKKYVSKPKGANPGAVVVRREEVVMVEPWKPE